MRRVRCRELRGAAVAVFSGFLATLAFGAAPSHSNSDVYRVLPSTASVLSYATGDLDGDGEEELALLYNDGGRFRLAAFAPRQGRWTPWWDAEAPSGARRMSLVDATGDGFPEIAVEALTPERTALVTRIMAYGWPGTDGPRFVTLIEDATCPPGYPLYGTEEGRPAVTFLSLGSRRPDGTAVDGHRRVYCWDGSGFIVCKEIVWKIP